MDSQSLSEFLHELDRQVEGDVRTDAYSRTLYSTDASIYRAMPYGVVIPRTVEDVHAAVELAVKHGVPLLPRAAGSSLAGQCVNEALVIDTTRHLDDVLEVNAEEQWVRVRPGIVLDQLNIDLRPYGLQFGPDPASSNRAAMGGIVSNNSTGSHSIRYGMTADHVLEAEVILSDGSTARFEPVDEDELERRKQRSGREGEIYRAVAALTRNERNREIIRTGTPRHWRRCGGYNLDRFVGSGVSFRQEQDPRFNLAKLVCGAEGGFGMITELKLGLVPVPTRTALAVVHFEALHDALTAVPQILEVDPSAVELLDHLGLTLCRDVPAYARLLDRFLVGNPNCLLITEFYGETERELIGQIERLKDHLAARGVPVSAIVPAVDRELQQDIWTVRKVGLGLLMSIKGDHKPIPFIEDAAVPVEHLAEYIGKVEQFCTEIDTRVAYYAHASAGCLHVRPLINAKDAADIAKLPDITAFSVELLRGYGGSLSSEHGDGRARSWINEQFFGPDLYNLYRQTKRIFDPSNLFNPGTVVEGPSPTESLRYGADYQVVEFETALDFSEDMGFHRAVEMCNGAGICRKRTTGTMCPSFMATREEEDSTRGRANALRAALSGRLPHEELTSPRMYEVMDLCISCKACKAECPSSVDMAKIKFEFLAQYYRANGTPRRAKLFGDVARSNRLGAGRMAPALNRMMETGPVRRLLEKQFGITRERPLPALARTPFTDWFRKRQGPAETTRRVVLYNDTFNTYNTPEVAIAAVEVLEAAGCEVLLPGHRCCGRPMISKGLVEEARAAALDTVERLAPFARQGVPIIGLEPSCLLGLRDEYAYLLPGDDRVELVAEHAVTFEEFMARLADEDAAPAFTPADRRLLLHGHCHQKALVGTKPTRRTLTLPEGYRVEEVDSGCCGMAGSFGYEAEHYDVSMRMAERRLLPAVRATDADTIIVAPGFSCRHQIEHGSNRTALHPAQVLRDALA